MHIKALKTVFNKLFDRRKNELEIENEEEIEEDYVAKCMGSFGLYQIIVCTIAGMNRFLATWNILSTVFITPETDFICKEFKDNVSVEVMNSTCYKDCIKYECYQQVFESTLISKFQLVCERARLANIAQTVLMLGVLVGSLIFGCIADRQGRRVAFRLAAYFNVIFMFIAAYSINYWIFITIRFLVGVTSGGIFVISTIYVLEVFGFNQRYIAVGWIFVADGIAEAMLAIFAYFSSTWDIFLMKYSAVSVLIFVLVLLLPDTLRWYVSQGNINRAVEVATRAALWNKKDPSHIADTLTEQIEKVQVPPKIPKTNYMHLFSDRVKTKTTISATIVFLQAGIGFYGIHQYMTTLLPNIYLSVIVFGLIQVPAAFLSIILNKFFVRRTLIRTAFFINGLSMASLTFLPKGHWITIITGAICISSVIIVYAIIFIFVAESYSTPLRCIALGVVTSGAVIGAIVVPFILTLKPIWVPAIIFAALPLLTLYICSFLPTTKGKHLRDTIN